MNELKIQPDFYELFLNIDLGKCLDQNELELLFMHGKILAFHAGETIIRQGKYSDGIYILVQGSVISLARILGEGTTVLETLEPGSYFGEISFIEKVPCATSLIANTEVQCLLITESYFDVISSTFHSTRFKLLNSIVKQTSTRIRKIHDKIINFISSSGMTPRSIISEIMQSFTNPAEINLEQAKININKIQKSQYFNTFTIEEINELFQHGVLLKAAKNCLLIHRNEKRPVCFLVLHGAVQSSILHENRIAKLSVIGPNILFSNIAFIDRNSEFTITFTTCEAAILLKLDESCIDSFKKNNPDLWSKIFYLIFRSLIALEKSVDKLDIRLHIETYNR